MNKITRSKLMNMVNTQSYLKMKIINRTVYSLTIPIHNSLDNIINNLFVIIEWRNK